MKNLLTKLSLTVPSLVLASTALVAVPVLAEDGSSGGSGSSNSTSGTSGSGDSTSSTSGGETQPEPAPPTGTKTSTESETEHETTARHEGLLMLQELRLKNKTHTEAERKLACESHKKGLSNKFLRINTETASFNSKIDAFLARAETYQKTNNVTVANWNSLVAAADAANTTSESSLAALKDLTPTVDCNGTSVAQDVATFKSAAQQARTDLQAYKAAVRAVVKALLDAKQASGGQQ